MNELTKKALNTLDISNNMIIKVLSDTDVQSWHRAEIKKTLIEFEEKLQEEWNRLYCKYGVNHVYKLPNDVYDETYRDFIQKPLLKIFKDYVINGLSWMRDNECLKVKKNPYLRIIAALEQKYKLSETQREREKARGE